MTKLEELKAAYDTAYAARGAYYTAAAAADAAAYDAWGAYRDELMKTQEENADD